MSIKEPAGSMFASEVREPLDFQPVTLPASMGVEAWQAERGSFVFMVARHPEYARGYSITISFRDDYLPKGPTETLEDAFSLCQRALHSLQR